MFLYQGNHYLYSRHTNRYFSEYFDHSYLNNGLGLEMEIHSTKKVDLSCMAGYAGYDSFEKIKVTAETGLFYTF